MRCPKHESPMPVAQPCRLSAAALARSIDNGELTAEAVMRSCLDRIAEREPVVRAWAHLDHDAALAAARACDKSVTDGLLPGVHRERGEPAGRRRRGAAGQDRLDRIRQPPSRPDRQSAQPGPYPRRL